MRPPVAVFHPSPGIRRALSEELDAHGFETTDRPGDLDAWLTDHPRAVVILPVDDELWASIRLSHPQAVLVAIVDHDDPHNYQHAYAVGASAVVTTTEALDDIAATVADSVAGHTRLPVHVAQHMAATASSGPPPDVAITDRELDALRRLAIGDTVAAVAHRLGVSEREMHRMLTTLYHRMGAHNRTEAIIRATRWGLLPEP